MPRGAFVESLEGAASVKGERDGFPLGNCLVGGVVNEITITHRRCLGFERLRMAVLLKLYNGKAIVHVISDCFVKKES